MRNEFANNIQKTVIPNPEVSCPPEIIAKQVSLEVSFWGFDGKDHRGIIEINKDGAEDIKAFFEAAQKLGFPFERILPASAPEFNWDDNKLMAANITSGFNYRVIAGTAHLSLHSQGLAFDVNPKQNPYIRYENNNKLIHPEGAVWDAAKPGTLHSSHPLVQLMTQKGWEWGGSWLPENGKVDYQHFQLSSAKQ